MCVREQTAQARRFDASVAFDSQSTFGCSEFCSGPPPIAVSPRVVDAGRLLSVCETRNTKHETRLHDDDIMRLDSSLGPRLVALADRL